MSVHDAMRAKALPQESARGVCARLGLRRVRVVTFNVNGLRTVAASGIDAFLRGLDADIVCVQETRASHAQLDEALVFPTGYTAFVSSCRTRDGYSGVATFCRDELLPVAAEEGVTGALRVLDPGRNADGVGPECMTEVMRGVPPLFSEAPAAAPLPAVSSPGVSGAELSPGALPSASGAPLTIPGAPQLDAEGRCVWTDHGAFVLANVYFPNNSDSGPRHLFRTSYLRAMEARIRLLQQAGRRVIVTGDFNARACAADSWWGDDPAQVPDRLKASFRAASSGRGGGAGGGGGASTQAGELRPSRLGGDSASATSTSPRPATPAPGGGSGGGGGGGGGQRYTAFPGIAEVYGPEAAARFHAPARAAADGLDSTDCGVDAVEQIARLREAEWLAWERESEAAFKEHAWLRPSARWRRGVAAARRTVLEGGGDGPSSGVGADTSAAAAATAIATTPATASLRAFGTMRAEEEPLPDGTADTSWALGRLWLRRLQADRVAGGCALRDAFRVVAPAQRHAYTCWDTKTAARVNNCGSRIDLFLVDAALAEGPTLADCRILSDVHGSDHAPVLLELALPDAAAQLTSSAARVVGPVAANPLHCASQPCALAVCRWPCFATRRQSRITAFFGQGGGSSPLALRLSPSSLCAATATAAVAMAPATTAAAATAWRRHGAWVEQLDDPDQARRSFEHCVERLRRDRRVS
mmetsp:Transcript_16847/g.53916  ORF Transcript_16847/g.53916 Transcript_16847/m.53916 type:complete len:700 (+) Transcript_16847:245-2344(+)